MDSGGAGRAAVRLHRSLADSGVQSKMLCLYKNSTDSDIVKYDRSYPLLKRLLLRLGFLKTKKEKNQSSLKAFDRSYFIFTFPFTDYNDLHQHELVRQADIIHLHWVAGFVDYLSFFKNVKKPIVWTIHDKNPVLGGFHLELDHLDNKNNSIGWLESKLEKIKQSSLVGHNISVVAPSAFLANYSSKSKALGVYPHYHIFNSIDLKLFKPVPNRNLVREKYNIPCDKPVLLFMSEGMEHKHKGGDLLTEALKTVDKEYCLITIGRGKLEGVKNVISFGIIKDDTKLVDLYCAADAAVLPSREDNLPNVMLEALACGTPVIGTPVGGMKDVIKDKINGYQTTGMQPSDIKETIELFIDTYQDFNRKSIRNFACDHFSMSKQAEAYQKLYRALN